MRFTPGEFTADVQGRPLHAGRFNAGRIYAGRPAFSERAAPGEGAGSCYSGGKPCLHFSFSAPVCLLLNLEATTAMLRHLLLCWSMLTVPVAALCSPVRKPAVCFDSPNTVADMACMEKEVASATAKMEDYLNAAKQRVARDGSLAPARLDASQAAWLRYQAAQCGDVHDFWGAGSYRNRAASMCQLTLIHARTIDIWASYLTYVDSTPPLRPEP